MAQEFNDLLQIALKAAEMAQENILKYFQSGIGVEWKKDNTPVTVADKSTEELCRKFWAKETPGFGVIGEEFGIESPDAEYQWVIDPIDGTTNFVAGIPHFAVSVAFVKNGESQMGVTFDPFCDEMFYAAKGQGAFLNGTPLPLRQNACHSLRDAVAAVEVKYLRSGTLAHRMQNLSPCRSQRNMGCSTLDWCYLAAGRFDVFLHGGQKLWDYAAGSLIATEAGGQLATLEGDDFWSGKHTFKRSVIAAIEPKLFIAWLKWVRDNQ